MKLKALHCNDCGILVGYIYFYPGENTDDYDIYCVEHGQNRL
jgi:hypothetical protein